MKRTFTGIFPAIVLPYDDHLNINEPELRSLASWLASVDGVSGIVCNGHAGEVASLDRAERKRVVQIVADEVGREVQVLGAVASENNKEAMELAEDIAQVGGSGLLVMPPHSWLRFGRQQGSAEAFFKDVASVGLPIVVHQYPAWTKASYPADTLLRLAEIPQVQSVKMGERDFAVYEYNIRTLREYAPHLSLLSCHDEYLYASLVYGLDGALVGFGSVVPELITALYSAMQNNDLARASAINDKLYVLKQAVYGQGEPSGAAHARAKEMLRQLGRISNSDVRPPVFRANEAESQRIAEAIEQVGLERAVAVGA